MNLKNKNTYGRVKMDHRDQNLSERSKKKLMSIHQIQRRANAMMMKKSSWASAIATSRASKMVTRSEFGGNLDFYLFFFFGGCGLNSPRMHNCFHPPPPCPSSFPPPCPPAFPPSPVPGPAPPPASMSKRRLLLLVAMLQKNRFFG